MSQERGVCVDDHCAFAGAKHYHGMSYPPEEWANMRAMLLNLEWRGDVNETGKFCPHCEANNTHKPDCEFAALLEKLR